jgi:hypothetical protein
METKWGSRVSDGLTVQALPDGLHVDAKLDGHGRRTEGGNMKDNHQDERANTRILGQIALILVISSLFYCRIRPIVAIAD